jgi:predicted AAA+ superfamily ATPase
MVIQRTFWQQRIEDAWNRRPIVWLVGVRRVGKTMLSQALDNVIYLDCELPSVQHEIADPEGFLSRRDDARIVLDEVHRLENPSQVLKIAADHYPGVRIVATGSSTIVASKKFSDTLTGRKSEVRLTPMNESDREAFGGSLEDRLWYGGLPGFYLGGEDVPVSEYVEWMDSYWARDVQELFGVRERAAFMRFVELLLNNSGGIFEARWYANACSVSHTTIANYLRMMEDTRVAHVVRPFSTRRASEIVSQPKVYAFDTGFSRFYRGWSGRRPEDFGLLWEQYVLNELQARAPEMTAGYWRDKQHREVDFVIARPGRSPVAIECKWRWQNIGDLKGLRAFRRLYPEGENFVVCGNAPRTWTQHVGEVGYEIIGVRELAERLAQPVPGK